jgi:hypothetical protein
VIAIDSRLGTQHVFEPEALSEMSRAFQEACMALKIFDGDEHGRRIIATRIIDLAGTGVIDAEALRDRVLLEALTARRVHPCLGNVDHEIGRSLNRDGERRPACNHRYWR